MPQRDATSARAQFVDQIVEQMVDQVKDGSRSCEQAAAGKSMGRIEAG